MRRTITIALALAGGMGLAGPAAAQSLAPAFHQEAERLMGELADRFRHLGVQFERHLRGVPDVPALGGPLSPAERPLISFMLEHRTELALTPEQVRRLEALRQEFAREAIRREADIRVAEMDLAALLAEDPPDLPRAEAKIRELAQLRAEYRIARLRTIEQGRALLTPEQRARLQGLLGMPPGRRATTGGVHL